MLRFAWSFALSVSIAAPLLAQPSVKVIAEGTWLNPLTGERRQAVIKPLVIVQPFDGISEAKTVQPLSGLNWKLWQADGPITLTVTVCDKQKRLKGLEVVFSPAGQNIGKFAPARNSSWVKVSVEGWLRRNEVTATVFVGEGERVVPKWRLTIRPEKRGKPVRFLLEFPATIDEPLRREWLRHLSLWRRQLRWVNDEYQEEVRVSGLPESGVLRSSLPVHSEVQLDYLLWWEIRPVQLRYRFPSEPPPATPADKALVEQWQQWYKQSLWRQLSESETVLLPPFHQGKVIITYSVTTKALVEAEGEVPDGIDLERVRQKVSSVMQAISPLTLLFFPRHPRPPEMTEEEHKRLFSERIKQRHQRDKMLTKLLQEAVAQTQLVNPQVRVVGDLLIAQPKSVEKRLEPLMLTFKVQLIGQAWCDYHAQTHSISLTGVVRFVPSQRVAIDRLKEVTVLKDGVEVSLPLAWVHPMGGRMVSVKVQVDGWQMRLPEERLSELELGSLGVDLWRSVPRTPVPFPIRLQPTHAETATFLLKLPADVQLSQASIIVQDEEGKVIASEQARWLEEWGGNGISLPKLPYGNYRVAAEGSCLMNGKEKTFSVIQTVRVQSYHTVVWLALDF